jgi:hypothetical protein
MPARFARSRIDSPDFSRSARTTPPTSADRLDSSGGPGATTVSLTDGVCPTTASGSDTTFT